MMLVDLAILAAIGPPGNASSAATFLVFGAAVVPLI
jgi:hypothetical protein